MRSKKPELYACPLCDEEIGPGYTTDELREHFKEDHLDQEGVNDFIKEVEETFTLIMTYVRALKETHVKGIGELTQGQKEFYQRSFPKRNSK